MRNLTLVATFGFVLGLTACAGHDKTQSSPSDSPVLRVAVRLVDKNDYNAFVAAHGQYSGVLQGQPGVGATRQFQSFYSGSKPDVPGRYVGLTELTVYESRRAFENARQATASALTAFQRTFTAEADILVRQPNGSTDLADFDGAALEIAVRTIDDAQEPAYDEAQAAFVAKLTTIPEVKTVEFQIVDAPAGVTAGYSTYASQAALQQTLAYYTNDPLSKTFFGSFELVSSQFGSATGALQAVSVPAAIALNDTAAPEDVVVHNYAVYTSDIATGSILKFDLFNQAAGATAFAAPSSGQTLSATWGLRIDEARSRLVVNQNPAYAFDGQVPTAGQVRAYDLSSGQQVGSWDLPPNAIGNPVVVDRAGKYYVGDIGPDARILKIDPETDAVAVWSDGPEFQDGGFGLGGMVYDGQGAIYGVQAPGLFYRVPIQPDGSAGAIERVPLLNASGQPFTSFAADGMAWFEGKLYYALNDAQQLGPQGTVFKVEFTTPTQGVIKPFTSNLKDPSGVFVARLFGTPTVFVNESQLGHAFGVDPGAPAKPFRVLTFAD